MHISLEKNQVITLEKGGRTLTRIRLGLGWDAVKRRFGRQKDIDLDASVIVYGDGKALDVIYFGQLLSRDGAINHLGDNLTGDGDGDDEQIIIDLTQVDPRADKLALVVTSYSGQSFDQVANVYARVNDLNDSEEELARYNLADTGALTGVIVAKLTRVGDAWQFTALGIPAAGRTASNLIPTAFAV
ncbi:TerD family protein [Curtobacterium sp. MCBD17_040]|uniref:TerD family protein n=1 Tax=Curtobacterium sp. MCBD17_040 TaxID=2175674 RepID=UPI000DA94082|nr:TerD family protein [Curtobacterium sp. MCBD17_040]WIB65397.1 TerD family protein [Curtobacterium sp. MCBD17_040]